jgi:hypothetical protein
MINEKQLSKTIESGEDQWTESYEAWLESTATPTISSSSAPFPSSPQQHVHHQYHPQPPQRTVSKRPSIKSKSKPANSSERCAYCGRMHAKNKTCAQQSRLELLPNNNRRSRSNNNDGSSNHQLNTSKKKLEQSKHRSNPRNSRPNPVDRLDENGVVVEQVWLPLN